MSPKKNAKTVNTNFSPWQKLPADELARLLSRRPREIMRIFNKQKRAKEKLDQPQSAGNCSFNQFLKNLFDNHCRLCGKAKK